MNDAFTGPSIHALVTCLQLNMHCHMLCSRSGYSHEQTDCMLKNEVTSELWIVCLPATGGFKLQVIMLCLRDLLCWQCTACGHKALKNFLHIVIAVYLVTLVRTEKTARRSPALLKCSTFSAAGVSARIRAQSGVTARGARYKCLLVSQAFCRVACSLSLW